MGALDPRKLFLPRRLERRSKSVVGYANIELANMELGRLVSAQPPTFISTIHFLPVPAQLAHLLPQAEPLNKAEATPKVARNLDTLRSTFKNALHAETNLCNAEKNSIRTCLLTIEEDIADIRRHAFRLKAFVVAGSLFLIAWLLALVLFL